MHNQYDATCKSCLSFQGEISLTPIPTIFESDCWRLEHIELTSIKGWLVLALKRHAAALHELTDQEWSELGEIQKVAIRGLHTLLGTQKEYVLQLAEAEGFNHVHFHFVAVSSDLNGDFRGAQIFKAHGPDVKSPVLAGDLEEFGQQLTECMRENYNLQS